MTIRRKREVECDRAWRTRRANRRVSQLRRRPTRNGHHRGDQRDADSTADPANDVENAQQCWPRQNTEPVGEQDVGVCDQGRPDDDVAGDRGEDAKGAKTQQPSDEPSDERPGTHHWRGWKNDQIAKWSGDRPGAARPTCARVQTDSSGVSSERDESVLR